MDSIVSENNATGVDRTLRRCEWVSSTHTSDMMIIYHDTEWGFPVHDDVKLFELLTLEIFQAGLSWEISLKKRSGLNAVFYKFDIDQVTQMMDDDIIRLKQDTRIIRNSLKIAATINNAQAIKRVQQTFGSFSQYLWSFTDNRVINHHVQHASDVLAQDDHSKKVSKDMKQRGFKFTGPVTIYSFLQAMGVINDHEQHCDFNPDNDALN